MDRDAARRHICSHRAAATANPAALERVFATAPEGVHIAAARRPNRCVRVAAHAATARRRANTRVAWQPTRLVESLEEHQHSGGGGSGGASGGSRRRREAGGGRRDSGARR
eukprot:2494035-Prymnesium_polylepis.1